MARKLHCRRKIGEMLRNGIAMLFEIMILMQTACCASNAPVIIADILYQLDREQINLLIVQMEFYGME